jgi:hypothetical protein
LDRGSKRFFNLGSGDKWAKYFVVGIGEEWEPVFSLIEDFGEEDEVGTVLLGGADLDTSEFDSAAFNEFGLFVIIRIYFLEDK